MKTRLPAVATVAIIVLLGAFARGSMTTAATSTGTTALVSVASNGTQANGSAFWPSISADGRNVAFMSYASNLVSGCANYLGQIFIHDQQTAQTTCVSVAPDGAQGNGGSYWPSISADGRYVAFSSAATNLVGGCTGGQIFVHDRQTGATTCDSVASAGTHANSASFSPSISADGRYVAFESRASNLASDDANLCVVGGSVTHCSDVFVHDRQTGETTRVSVASNGAQGNGDSGGASISADGRYVAFSSAATNLVDNDTNGAAEDIFVHDLQTRETTLVSVASNGTQANSGSYSPSISSDARYVAFGSAATNLVDNDTNGAAEDIFVHDLQTRETTLVSAASNGTQANSASYSPSISADGRYVAFLSGASNLVCGDTNNLDDVFLHDRQTGQTTRISVASNGSQANGSSNYNARLSISADGRYVAFSSAATNLVDNDTNGALDVFVHDSGGSFTTYCISGRVSDSSNNPIAGATVVAASTVNATNIMTVTTDATGYYAFTNAVTDTYRVRPFTSLYAFTPAWRDKVAVPPSATGQDFAGTPTLPAYRVDVNPLWQDMPPWGSKNYDSNGLIAGNGCLLTDYTMVVNYFGQQTAGKFQTDPFTLNSWLVTQGANGYVCAKDGCGLIVPGAPFTYATGHAIPLYWDSWLPRFNANKTNNDGTLDAYLQMKQPVILDEGGHFVLSVGKITDALGSTYAIVDPYFPRSTLRDYNNSYLSMSQYSPWTPNFNDLASLYIGVASPVQLLVTDPSGKRTGYDPATGQILDEIPNSNYTIQTLVDQLNPNNPPSEAKFFYANEPANGSYQISLVGTGSGTFTLSVIGKNQAGLPSSQVLTGETTTGQMLSYQVSYSSSGGVGSILNSLYLPIILR